jgi:hypothetical protein
MARCAAFTEEGIDTFGILVLLGSHPPALGQPQPTFLGVRIVNQFRHPRTGGSLIKTGSN